MHFFRRQRIRRRTRRELDTAIRDGKSIVLIYQPGKVASSTITRTLQQCPQLSVWQIHTLIPEVINQLVRSQQAAGMKPVKCLLQGEVIREELLIRQRASFRVITLVREPIERNVSAYFERFSEFFPGRTPDQVPLDLLDQAFLERFDHRAIVDWNDQDLYQALGVDVYTVPFHKENGYSIVPHADYDTLVMRTTLDDQRKISAISLFLNMEDTPRLVTANQAEQKVYRDEYRAFRKRIKLHQDLCAELLGSRYARHFFTDAERYQAMQRWAKEGPTWQVNRAA